MTAPELTGLPATGGRFLMQNAAGFTAVRHGETVLNPAPNREIYQIETAHCARDRGVMRRLSDLVVRTLRPGWVRRVLAPVLDRYENFAPIQQIGLPAGQRLAVIAPHPDDESIGAGGLIALWQAAGRQTDVTFLTRGEQGNPALRTDLPDALRSTLMDDTARTRRTEAEAAIAILNARAEYFDGSDGALWRDENRIADALANLWRAAPPDVIAAPDPADRHIDHAAAARITARAAQQAGLRPDTPVLGYEVWSPCPANAALPIAEVADVKTRAIAAHNSQTASTDYVAAAAALNLYRGVTAGMGTTPAEGFHRQTLTAYAAQSAQMKP